MSEVLWEDQYGLPNIKLTTDATPNLTWECHSALNTKVHLVSVFLDLSKAFDTKVVMF